MLIIAGSPAAPAGWAHLTHEPAAWRGVYVKPAHTGDEPLTDHTW